MTQTELIDMHLKSMVKHNLSLICDTELVKCYYMGEEGTGIFCVYITFTPAGICIQGDFTPERNGSTSVRGYGVGWFAGGLSDSYVAEKFLTKGWYHELAKNTLLDKAKYEKDDHAEGWAEKLERIAERIEYHDAEWLYNELDDMEEDTSDGIPGNGYAPHEHAALIAIQRKFSELYHKVCAETK